MKYESPRFAKYTFDFGRVNVILGANGSGKSGLLRDLRDAIPSLKGGAKPVFIEGGRTITIMDVLQSDARNFQQYDRLESALAHYEGKRAQSLAGRVFDALVVLEKRELQIKARHSDAVEVWNSGDRRDAYPRRARAPLARLFELFGEVFPHIQLTFDYEARRLSAEKNGLRYGPSSLSDGEKQVFSVLADLIDLEDARSVIIADEPELNLHPELAERLWTLIESEFPDKTFIYATHSINFALRESVEKTFVLSSNSESICEFRGFGELPRTEVRAFLGGLPGILSANRVVVTEGHEKSFDALFYRWLFGDTKIEIHAAGGCTDVANVAAKGGLWNSISTRVALVGVVDRDFRDDEYLAALAKGEVIPLGLHEAESYLCLPEIVAALGERIGSQERTVMETQVLEEIETSLRSQRLAIGARRVFARSRMHLAVSIERRVLASAATREQLLEELRTASEVELQKAVAELGIARLESALDAELARIDSACDARDAKRMLQLLPSKELASRLARRVGLSSSLAMMRSLRANFKPSDFTALVELLELFDRATAA